MHEQGKEAATARGEAPLQEVPHCHLTYHLPTTYTSIYLAACCCVCLVTHTMHLLSDYLLLLPRRYRSMRPVPRPWGRLSQRLRPLAPGCRAAAAAATMEAAAAAAAAAGSTRSSLSLSLRPRRERA